MRKLATWSGTIAVVVAAFAVPASATAAEVLTASPSLAGKLGGPGVLTVRGAVSSSLGGIPSPLTQLVIDVPPGFTYNFSTLPLCPLATITAATGSIAPVCPSGSEIGAGSATVMAALGATTLTESTTIDIYAIDRSPFKAEVWGNGTSPVAETLTFPGTFGPTSAPFAEQIGVDIPPIPTVPGGPDASVTSLDFTLGGMHTATAAKTVKRGRKSVKETVKTSVGLFDLPKTCTGSIPYAVSTSFADGSTVPYKGTLPCP